MNGMVGILLAAGRSRRMGMAKQLLPWPPTSVGGGEPDQSSKTMIAASFDTIAPHCDRIIIVLGNEIDAIRRALGNRSYSVVASDPNAEMIASIRAGISAAASSPACLAALLHPSDVPGVGRQTITTLIEARFGSPESAIMPEYLGKGGHPVIIPRGLFAAIESHREAGGLRTLWRRKPDRCVQIAVNDPGCVRDIDTPEEYVRGVV